MPPSQEGNLCESGLEVEGDGQGICSEDGREGGCKDSDKRENGQLDVSPPKGLVQRIGWVVGGLGNQEDRRGDAPIIFQIGVARGGYIVGEGTFALV